MYVRLTGVIRNSAGRGTYSTMLGSIKMSNLISAHTVGGGIHRKATYRSIYDNTRLQT